MTLDERNNPYHFFLTNQQKVNTGVYSWIHCDLIVNWFFCKFVIDKFTICVTDDIMNSIVDKKGSQYYEWQLSPNSVVNLLVG